MKNKSFAPSLVLLFSIFGVLLITSQNCAPRRSGGGGQASIPSLSSFADSSSFGAYSAQPDRTQDYSNFAGNYSNPNFNFQFDAATNKVTETMTQVINGATCSVQFQGIYKMVDIIPDDISSLQSALAAQTSAPFQSGVATLISNYAGALTAPSSQNPVCQQSVTGLSRSLPGHDIYFFAALSDGTFAAVQRLNPYLLFYPGLWSTHTP